MRRSGSSVWACFALPFLMACGDVAAPAPVTDAGGCDGSDAQAREWPADVAACGSSCGEGPQYVLDRIMFIPVDEKGRSRGFDLDDQDGGCEVADLRSPGGDRGIDNRIGELLSVVPGSAVETLPGIVQTAIDSGQMSILLEAIDIIDFEEERETVLVARMGVGSVLQGADGHLLAGQTFALDEDPILGVAKEVFVGEGRLDAGPFLLRIRLTYLGSVIKFRLFNARLALTYDPTDDSLSGTLGGMVPLEDTMELIGLLGGDDTDLRELLEELVPGFVDSRIEKDGPCDALSGALEIHGVRAFIFHE